MGYQLTLRSPSGEQTISIDRTIVVGRDPSCDVPIDSVRVSRRHAEFSPTPTGVLVRDLGSRNGLMVNGMRVDQAQLGPGDRVLLGDVTATIASGGAAGPHTSTPPPSPFGSAPPPSPFGAAPPTVPFAAPAPPSFAPNPPSGYPPSAPTTPLPAAQGYGPPQPWAQPSGQAHSDKTTVLPAGGAMPMPGAMGMPGVARVPAAAGPAARKGLASRMSVNARVTIGVMLAAFLMFLVTAIPLSQARSSDLHRESLARVATITRSLGAENGTALASGQTLAVGVQNGLAEPGVREVLLLSPEGRVLAPAERLDQTVTKLPAFGEIAAIQGLQTADLGNEVQAAALIESGGRRLGVVWVRLDPSYASTGAPVVLYMFAALFTGLVAAFVLAHLLRKAISTRLLTLATDIDMAAAGQMDVVTESIGEPRLAEAVNFIIGRLRTAPQQVMQQMAPPMAAQAVAPAQPVNAREGHVVLDGSFIVKEASSGAAQLLRTTQQKLEGHHVLEAIPEQALVNAIIDAIGDIASQGRATRRTEGPGGEPGLELVADRAAPDGPITITIRRLG